MSQAEKHILIAKILVGATAILTLVNIVILVYRIT